MLEEESRHAVDVLGIHQRLVALHVEDDVHVEVLHGREDPVRARRQRRVGHDGPSAGGFDRSRDPLVVGRDEDEVDAPRLQRPLEDPDDHGGSGDRMERFSRKALRPVAGGDDGDDGKGEEVASRGTFDINIGSGLRVNVRHRPAVAGR